MRSALGVLRSLRLGAQPGTVLMCPSSTAERNSAHIQSVLTECSPSCKAAGDPQTNLLDVGIFPTSPEPTLHPQWGVTASSFEYRGGTGQGASGEGAEPAGKLRFTSGGDV